MQKMDEELNFVFWGTPDVASETLEILKQAGLLPSLIVTSPDKPQGRKMLITPPAVKTWAVENNIPYIQPDQLADLKRSDLKGENGFRFAFFIVVAYGKIMPENILKMPVLGSINLHYSLLPKYRGASPIESAILNGDKETGVTIQQMEFKIDSGPILAQERVTILPEEKASDLRKRLIKIGGELLVKTLPRLAMKEIKAVPQNEDEATYCKKIKKEDGLIDLIADPVTNYNKFRAYAAWPRTFFFVNNKRIIITNAVLEDNKFIIKKVLPEGRNEMRYEDFKKAA